MFQVDYICLEYCMNDGQQPADERLSLEPEAFIEALLPEERMLIRIRDELYEGSWETMRHDLENRLAGKPYIFKLVNRIKDDIERIEEMKKFEAEHNIDLADHVELP